MCNHPPPSVPSVSKGCVYPENIICICVASLQKSLLVGKLRLSFYLPTLKHTLMIVKSECMFLSRIIFFPQKGAYQPCDKLLYIRLFGPYKSIIRYSHMYFVINSYRDTR